MGFRIQTSAKCVNPYIFAIIQSIPSHHETTAKEKGYRTMGDQQEDINNLVDHFAALGVEGEIERSTNKDVCKLADRISSGKVSKILVLSGAGVRVRVTMKPD